MRKYLSDVTDKGLISKYINNSYTLISKNNLIKTWAGELNGHFFIEDA